MSAKERLGALEIDEDLIFERRQWGVQRAGWLVMLLIVLAGLAGLLGPGPVSRAETSAGGIAVEYERVVRKLTLSELHVHLEPGTPHEGEVTLMLSQGYLDKVDVTQVLPEPTEMVATGDGTLFRFAVEDSESAVDITFDVEPVEPGMVRGQLGLPGGDAAGIEQLIFP